MNHSKKITLLSLLFVAQATTTIFCTQKARPTAEETISTTMQRIQEIPTYITHLPTSDFLVASFFALLGAAAGHLGTCAVAHLLDQKTNIKPSFFHPQDWGRSLWLGTVGGAATIGYLSLASSGPKFLAQQVNQPLLVLVISVKPNDLKNSLDNMYVSNRFARAAAFKDLDILQNTLSGILESFTKLQGRAGHAEAKSLTPTIVSYITMVKDAMLVIKNDPRWLEECNASTLAMTQANIQGHQNAQLASTVIQLAHR